MTSRLAPVRFTQHATRSLFNSFNRFFFCFFCSFVFTLSRASSPLPAVPTEQHPVTNSYQGVSVADDYQWLEDPAAPEVREWMRLQNERTRAYFNKLPFREGIAQQLLQLRTDESARVFGLT